MDVIKLENIKKVYKISDEFEQTVLKGIDLTVSQGDFVAIIGPSGSGKSTLMNIIGCLDGSSSGDYYLDGINIKTLSLKALANIRNKKIGFIFQNFNLMARRDLLDNVALPLLYRGENRAKRRKKAQEILIKVGLFGYENYFPTQLSGGMKQRVAIARALVTAPSLILADEPTGNLDSDTTQEILNVLKELNMKDNITIIMITHEHDVASQTKRIVEIRDGIMSEKEAI